MLNVRRLTMDSPPQRASCHSVLGSQNGSRLSRGMAPVSFLGDFRGEFRAVTAKSRARRHGIREPRPCDPTDGKAHASHRDAVFGRESRLRLAGGVAPTALKDDRFRQACALMRVAAQKGSVSQPVLAGVLGVRTVGKVGDSVISYPSGTVTHDESLRARSGKSLHDQLVHQPGLRAAIHVENYPQVTAVADGRPKHRPAVGVLPSVAVDHYPVHAAHAALVADLVRAFCPSDRQPSLGHSIIRSHCGLLYRSWWSGPGCGARNTVRAAIEFLLIIADSPAFSATVGTGDS